MWPVQGGVEVGELNLVAKEAKELEWEAKEKEHIDGQLVFLGHKHLLQHALQSFLVSFNQGGLRI